MQMNNGEDGGTDGLFVEVKCIPRRFHDCQEFYIDKKKKGIQKKVYNKEIKPVLQPSGQKNIFTYIIPSTHNVPSDLKLYYSFSLFF